MAGNQENFQKALSQGHSAAWDQMWDRAAAHYRQALDEFPQDSSALTSLALALFEQQEYAEAQKYYALATRAAPEDPIPHEKLARIYERQGKPAEAAQSSSAAAELHLKLKDAEKAAENWVRAIGFQPENSMLRTRLAMLYERMGRKGDAVSEYLAAASLLQQQGNIEKALQAAQYCHQILPESEEARQVLAMLRRGLALPKPSRPRGFTGSMRMATVQKTIKNDVQNGEEKPQNPLAEAQKKALFRLANLMFDQTGDDETLTRQPNRRGVSAITRGTGSLSLEKSDQARVQMIIGQAVESYTRGDAERAAEELEHALEAGLNNPAALFILGMVRSETRPEKAIKYLQRSVLHSDFSLASQLIMAQIHLRAEALPEAAVCSLRSLGLADAAVVRNEEREELHQLYEPIIEAQKQINDPNRLSSLCENILAQLMREDWRSHLKNLRQQLSPQPPGSPPLPLAELLLETGSAQVVDSMGQIRQLSSQNLLASAMEEAFRALVYAPTYLPLHVQIGDLLLSEGRVSDAVQKYMLVAEDYNLQGEVSQAIRLLLRVTQISPMDQGVRIRLIELLNTQGRVEDAIHQSMSLANIYYQLTDLDKARQTYSNALRMAQQSRVDRSLLVQILYKIADIDQQRLELRQAILVYEQIRTIEPQDSTARSTLVDLNFRLGQDTAAITEVDGFIATLEESGRRPVAIKFLNDLIAERPEKLELRKRLADVLARGGNIPEAAAQLDSIADSLLNAGNRSGAVTILQAIISLNPPNVAEYRSALQQIQSMK